MVFGFDFIQRIPGIAAKRPPSAASGSSLNLDIAVGQKTSNNSSLTLYSPAEGRFCVVQGRGWLGRFDLPPGRFRLDLPAIDD